MTKDAFKQAMLRGQGRCIQAVRTDPEKYRDIVMWACQNDIAYDTQCEGARTWFVYQMVCCYEDRSPFIRSAAHALLDAESDGSWQLFALSELLWYFACDGNRGAKAALEKKYRAMYHALLTRTEPINGTFYTRDDFDKLCVILADSRDAFLRIASDIGHLYRSNPLYDAEDFSWLYESKGTRYRRSLERTAETSEDLACYLKHHTNADNAPPVGKPHSPLLTMRKDPEAVKQFAEAYLQQTTPVARAKALQPFVYFPFPYSPEPLIADTHSHHPQLCNMAWRALEQLRCPEVREYALSMLNSKFDSALPVFIRNYTPADGEALVRMVRSIPVDFEATTMWHGIHLDILAMEDFGQKAPPSLLQHIYETSYCSCCRAHALRQMGKRRLLTIELLMECLYDSNDEIRDYAKRALKRRKKV